MPAGTWNLPKIQKTVPYRGIKDISTIEIFDTTPTSDNYFNVIQFPDRLTSGKNLFKINAATPNLVDNSEVHIEILDYNGNPIYFEPLTYLEQDGTRVIAVYVYPNTSPGLATVYIAGRARFDVFNNNRPLPYVDNLRDTRTDGRMVTGKNELFKDFPNLLWQRTINVAPEKRNSSQIIFTENPKVTVVERVVNYQQPLTLNNVNIAKNAPAGASITIEPVPIQGGAISNAASLNNTYALNPAASLEGATSRNTPVASAGRAFATETLFTGNASNTVDLSSNTSIIAAANQTIRDPAEVPDQQTSQGVTLNTGYSRATFENFPLSASMEGGMIVVKNPKLSIDIGTALVGSPLQVMPAVDAGDLRSFLPDAISSGDQSIAMSGSVVFVITDVESTSQAKVSQLAGPGHAAPILSSFNFVALKTSTNQSTLQGGLDQPLAYDIKSIDASAEFTSSHTEPLVYTSTAQSQSFAEVVLGNIEPATGDVYKIRTSYKPAGQFGDFISAGDTILERIELLEDTGSFEGAMSIGQIYNRIGYFTSLDDINEYWQVDNSDEFVTSAITFNDDIAINSAYPFSAQNFNTTNKKAIVFQIKDDYMPTVVKNARYAVRLRAINTVDILSSYDVTYGTGNNTTTITKPRFDVYISGSAGQGTILPIDSTYNAYRMTDYDIEPTLTGKLADDGYLGKLIGTVEMEPSVPGGLIGSSGVLDPSIVDVMFSFESTEAQNIKLSLVPRGSNFAFKGIGITTDSETGFSPNHTRLNIRIPSEFINVPMIFKFEYFDFLGRKSDTETTVFPIKFLGDNTVINGDSNLLSGSVFIGNSIGSGIELAGVRSGFIRAVGYEGFISASQTNKPGGFLFYTGSVLPDSPDGYTGVGMELVADSGSFLRFATADDVSGKKAGLEVRTERFFLGSNSQFISGANGNIEISSSNFHLDSDGDVVMQGSITAEAGGTIGGWGIGNTALSSSGNTVMLDSDGPYHISSSGFQVDTKGAITASAGRIAGFEIDDHSLTTTGVEINDSSQHIFISSSAFKVDHAGNITASNVSMSGAITAQSGLIGGFTINNDGIRGSNLFISGSPATGGTHNTKNMFISTSKFNVKEDGSITASSANIEGKITATSGQIGGFEITSNEIKSGTAIQIKSDVPGVNIKSTTFGNDGIQLQDNSGNPRAHIGNSQAGIRFESSTNSLQITSSNVNISGSNVTLSTPKFFFGGPAAFISGANGNIEITSSKFHLTRNGDITGSSVMFTGGEIAGWSIDKTKLSNTGVHLSASYGIKAFSTSGENTDFVELKYKANDNYGVMGQEGGNVIFALGKNVLSGEANNQIAGWEFDNEKLQGGKMIIRQDGTIESDGFASNVAGSGFRLTANDGGFLEVENARIRGTLSTAVFEKESVNAVGGQLYVANSTVLTGSGQLASSTAPLGLHRATDTTMSVENVSGFAQGEILSLKKISSTGFQTEYIFINSASRNNPSSDTDFTGKIFVKRGYSGSDNFAGNVSGSLGDFASAAQSYSGSQVLVSTGKVGTGYIRLNANPNDTTTPYIDIVERTGSAIYDIDLKARLGDLSGITDSSFSDDVTGFGLYTQNGYFKGKIEIGSRAAQAPNDKLFLHYNFQGSTNNKILSQTPNGFTASFSNVTHLNFAVPGAATINTVAPGTELQGPLSINANEFTSSLAAGQNAFSAGFRLSFASESMDKNTFIARNYPRFVVYKPSDDSINFRIFSGSITNDTSYLETISFSTPANTIKENDLYHIFVTAKENHSASIDIYNVTSGSYAEGAAVALEFANNGGDHTFGWPAEFTASSYSEWEHGAPGWAGSNNKAFHGTWHDIRYYKDTVLSTSQMEAIVTNTDAASGGTIIDGDSVQTGKIRSNNFGASVGSELDLDAGTFKLGGSADPKLEFDGSDLIVSGTIQALAGEIGGFSISEDAISGTSLFISGSPISTGAHDSRNMFISTSKFNVKGDGSITGSNVLFTGGTIGGFELTATEIKDSNNNLRLKSSGQISGSKVLFDGGKIAGWTINSTTIGSGSSQNQGGQAIRFNNKSTAGTNTYQSNQTTAKGLHIQTHESSNASSLIVGEIISDANGNLDTATPAFNDWYGIQGIKWNDNNPFFQLAFKGTGTSFTTNNSIAGWNFDNEKLTGGAFEINKAGYLKSGTNWKISASAANSDPAGFISSSAFKVSADGRVTGSQVLFDGGKIGGFTIAGDNLSTNSANDTGNITLGNNQLRLSATNGTYRLWAGDAAPTNAPFSINKLGDITASSALFTGEVVATNLTETFVSVNDGNDHLYLRTVTGGKNLVFDGSLGGDIITNMEISTSAAFEIKDVELPFTGSNRVTADVFIVTSGMTFDEGTVSAGFSVAASNILGSK